jgi:hypothetical protein
VKSDEMVAVAALREVHVQATREGIKGITCRLPVESMNYMINAWRNDIAATEKEFSVPISLLVDTKLLPGQYKIDVERVEAPKEPQPKAQHKAQHKEQHKEHPRREQRPIPQQQTPVPEPERGEESAEQQAQPAAPLSPEPQEQKRRRKRRPRRGRKYPRREEAAVPEEAAGAPIEENVTDPIQEGI